MPDATGDAAVVEQRHAARRDAEARGVAAERLASFVVARGDPHSGMHPEALPLRRPATAEVRGERRFVLCTGIRSAATSDGLPRADTQSELRAGARRRRLVPWMERLETAWRGSGSI